MVDLHKGIVDGNNEGLACLGELLWAIDVAGNVVVGAAG